MRTLLLGGVRSGKSRRAVELGLEFEQRVPRAAVTVVATATPSDDEMRLRIEAHRRERPASWTTLEEPRRLGGALKELDRPERLMIVDCLTVWLATLLLEDDTRDRRAEIDSLLEAVDEAHGSIVFVSNETGLGVVPCAALARRFNDAAGRLHQSLAARCERVELLIAGLPLPLKSPLGIERGLR